MSSEEVESQLSAMFDGELPPAECELLSRRLEREDALRARWSRYALIGAAMRSEPVATARSGFARRVSQALSGTASARPQRRGWLWNASLAAGMVAGVAGLSIMALRHSTLGASVAALASVRAPIATSGARALTALVPAQAPQVNAAVLRPDAHEPLSYVTPSGPASGGTQLRTELADYIVAHSEYSNALMRRNLLSELMMSSGESASAGADVQPVARPAAAVRVDAVSAVSSDR